MKKNLIYIVVVVVVYLIISNTISNYSDLPLMFPVAFLFIALFGYFLVTDYLLSENDEEKLSDNIIGKMRKEGYQCEKDEGVLTYMMNGRKFYAHLWKTNPHSFKVEIVDYCRIDEEKEWDEVSIEGKAILANYINQEHGHTEMIANKGGIILSFCTAICESDDFIRTAQLSYRVLEDTLSKVYEVYPKLKELYAANEKSTNRSIGFLNKEKD